MSITDWVQAAGTLLTFVGSVFILLTLLEMKKQRKSAYLPDLIVEPSPDSTIFADALPPDIFASFHLHVINVGLGAAKELSVIWMIDIHSLIEAAIPSASSRLEIDEGKKVMKVTYTQSGKSTEVFFSLAYNSGRNTGHLLPSTHEANPLALPVPSPFSALVQIISHNLSSSLGAPDFDATSSLKSHELTLLMEWRSIDGELFTKKFLVHWLPGVVTAKEVVWDLTVEG